MSVTRGVVPTFRVGGYTQAAVAHEGANSPSAAWGMQGGVEGRGDVVGRVGSRPCVRAKTPWRGSTPVPHITRYMGMGLRRCKLRYPCKWDHEQELCEPREARRWDYRPVLYRARKSRR